MLIFSHEEMTKAFNEFVPEGYHWKDAATQIVSADKLAVTLAALDFMLAPKKITVVPMCMTPMAPGVDKFEYAFKVSSSGYGAD